MERDETQTTGSTPAPTSDAASAPPPKNESAGGGTPEGSSQEPSKAGSAQDGAAQGQNGPTGPDGQPRKRRRRGKRGGKRHRKKPSGDKAPAPSGGDNPADGPGEQPDGDAGSRAESGGGEKPAAPRARTRSSSKPRTPRAPKEDGDAAPAAKADASAQDDGKDVGGGAPAEAKKTVPAKAGGSGEGPDAEDKGGDGDAAGEGGPKKRRRRGKRGGRGRSKSGGGGQKQPAKADDDKAEKKDEKKPAAKKADRSGGSTRLKARQLRKDQQRKRGRRPRRLTEDDAARLRGGDKVMLVHEHDDRTQIAVLEEGTLIEHYVARKGERTTMAGNIFLGKVQNVLPSMEAAFVDFGRGRNGVLYAGEVNYSAEDLEGEAPRIEKVLKSGQPLMVQVTKDPIGNKGARLTTQISLAGRYMVLAPEQQLTGISRRLADKERARLRSILKDIRPNGHGVIVRTAAEGASREALERDLQNLLKTWEAVQKNAKKAKAPALLYAEPELVSRVVRDIFSGETKQIVVDDRSTFVEIHQYLEETGPEEIDKLTLHEGPLPLFETYRVTEQLHKALERKVWLPSGGSLVIDRTEAMTVIDVNTGKFTGKGSNLEETVFKNNLEAADEVARQLRLRDIGGIIVVDFIDMIDPNNQKELLRTLKRALSKDKTRSQVFDVTNLGLVEMTRKRVSEGLLEAFSEPCPNCEGRGIVMTHEID